MLTFLSSGTFGAFDFYGDFVVGVDEAKNQIIKTDVTGDNAERYPIPVKYKTERYFWLKIHFINENVLVALLKCHRDKSFHLLSLLLDPNLSCTAVCFINTGILSYGFKVECRRAGSQLVYSICNSKNYKQVPKRPPRECDRTRFLRQLRAATVNGQPIPQQQQSATTEVESKPPDNPDIQQAEAVEEDIPERVDETFVESVILLVRHDHSGNINSRVVSTGRSRYGIKLRRTRSVRTIRRTFSNKFMTKWDSPEAGDLSEPFLWGNQAVVICRSESTHVFVAGTVMNPRSGFLASIVDKLRHLRMHTPSTTPTRAQVYGEPPVSRRLWSNVEVVNGCPAVLTIDRKTREASLFHLVRSPNNVSFEWRHWPVALDVDATRPVRVAIRANAKDASRMLIRIAEDEETEFRHATSSFQLAVVPTL